MMECRNIGNKKSNVACHIYCIILPIATPDDRACCHAHKNRK
jgi:hypothetical protein